MKPSARQRNNRIFVIVFGLYAVMLGIGAVAELCGLRWILDLPIYRL